MVSTPLKNIAQNGFIFPNFTGEHIFELLPPRYTQQNHGNNFKLFFSGRLTPWFAWRSCSLILGVIQVGNYHTYTSSSNGIRLGILGQNFGTAKKHVHKIEPRFVKHDVCIFLLERSVYTWSNFSTSQMWKALKWLRKRFGPGNMSRLHGLWKRICFQTRRPYTSYHAAIPLHLLPHCSKLLLMEEIQLTTWEIKQHVNNGIDYQPQLAHDFFHQQYLLMRICKNTSKCLIPDHHPWLI